MVVVAGRLVKPAAPRLHPAALGPRRRADPGASSHPGHTAPSPGRLPRSSLLAVSPQTTSGVHRVPCGSALNRPRTNTPACRGPGDCTHPASCTCQPSACRGTWLLPASPFRRYLPGEAGLCQRTRDREPCALTRPRVTPPAPKWEALSRGRGLGESPHGLGLPRAFCWGLTPPPPASHPLPAGARGAGQGASKQDKATYPITRSHRGERPQAR